MIYQVGDLVMYIDDVCCVRKVRDSMVSNSQVIVIARRDGQNITTTYTTFIATTSVQNLIVSTSDKRISPVNLLSIAARDYKERKHT